MLKTKRVALLFMTMCLTVCSYAQQQEAQLYQQAAGDYAFLYQGHLEDELVQRVWANIPYLETADFRTGSIRYAGMTYENVPMRYDAHEQHVVVMSPVKNAKVIPDQRRVEWFTLDGRCFVPNETRGGFSRQVFAGHKVSLLDHHYKTVGNNTENLGKVYRSFNDHQQYYILTDNGQLKSVRSLSQLYRMFPEFKHELRRYAAQHHLSFSTERREASLTSCVSYLDTLIP